MKTSLKYKKVWLGEENDELKKCIVDIIQDKGFLIEPCVRSKNETSEYIIITDKHFFINVKSREEFDQLQMNEVLLSDFSYGHDIRKQILNTEEVLRDKLNVIHDDLYKKRSIVKRFFDLFKLSILFILIFTSCTKEENKIESAPEVITNHDEYFGQWTEANNTVGYYDILITDGIPPTFELVGVETIMNAEFRNDTLIIDSGMFEYWCKVRNDTLYYSAYAPNARLDKFIKL